MPVVQWSRWSSSNLLVVLLTMLVTLIPADDGGADSTPSDETVRVEGVVTYDGRLPEPIPVAEAGTSRQPMEVDPKTKGLNDAVVWLEGVPEPASHQEFAGKPILMDQQNFFFVPHVLAVKSGQAVEFRNSDVANHGVKASSLEPRNQFNVMIPFGGHYDHRFVASKYPVAIGCPIHTAMAAWVFVFDHRFHAVTDKTGRFTLPPVASGAIHAPCSSSRWRSAEKRADHPKGRETGAVTHRLPRP